MGDDNHNAGIKVKLAFSGREAADLMVRGSEEDSIEDVEEVFERQLENVEEELKEFNDD